MISCHRVEILKKPKVPVFIFIDEIRELDKKFGGTGKNTKLSPEMELLKAVAGALQSPDQPTFLISTLDHTPLLRLSAISTLIVFALVPLCHCNLSMSFQLHPVYALS